MLVHLDNVRFKHKPTGQEIGGIKARMTNIESICDVTAQELAAALTRGQTVQPGVTPYSDRSRALGRKGTTKEDFACQTVFMVDIDNADKDLPLETPAHVGEVLYFHRLKAAFMYETFGSVPECIRFRFAVVCDEDVTDRTERDRIQQGLIALFPQADAGCINADRIFYGTDKGLFGSMRGLYRRLQKRRPPASCRTKSHSPRRRRPRRTHHPQRLPSHRTDPVRLRRPQTVRRQRTSRHSVYGTRRPM